MNTYDMLRQFARLGVSLSNAMLVWGYYRERSFAAAERYSTFGPRFWTGSVDKCVLWPVGFITAALLSLNIPRAVAGLLFIVQGLAWLLYTVVMHARYGQTVGKMVTKVRVVDFRTEGRISWRQAWLRESLPMVMSLGFLGWVVFLILCTGLSPKALANGEASLAVRNSFWLLTALPASWFMAEVLTMLTNNKRRALHDFIAGTVVVRTNIEQGFAQQNAPPLNGGPAAPLAHSDTCGGPPSVS
jgi:uncharacterized RDD family membrane protein YckC